MVQPIPQLRKKKKRCFFFFLWKEKDRSYHNLHFWNRNQTRAFPLGSPHWEVSSWLEMKWRIPWPLIPDPDGTSWLKAVIFIDEHTESQHYEQTLHISEPKKRSHSKNLTDKKEKKKTSKSGSFEAEQRIRASKSTNKLSTCQSLTSAASKNL